MSYLPIRLIIGLLYQAVRSLLAILYVIFFLPKLLAGLISNITNSDEYIAISETISDFNDKPMGSQVDNITTSSQAPYANTSLQHSNVPYANTFLQHSNVPYALTPFQGSNVPYAPTSPQHPPSSPETDDSASKEEQRGWLATQVAAYFVRSQDPFKGARKDSEPVRWGSISWNPVRLSGPLGLDITTLRELEGKAWEGFEEREY